MYNIEQNDIEYADFLTRKCLRGWHLDIDEDDIQNGRLAMVVSSKKFNPDKSNSERSQKTKFWNYAGVSIRNILRQERFNKDTNGILRHSCISRNSTDHVSIDNLTDSDSILKSNDKTLDCIINRDLICKSLNTMHPWVAKAAVDSAFDGTDLSETSRKLGYCDRSLATILGQWRAGDDKAILNTEDRKKQHWKGKISCDLEFLVGLYPNRLRNIISCRNYYQKNKIKVNARNTKNYHKNKAMGKEYKPNNKEYRAKYYQKNKIKLKEYRAKHYQKNKARINKQCSEYYLKNKEAIKEKSRIRYAEKKDN